MPPSQLQTVRRHPARGSQGLMAVLTPRLNLHPSEGKQADRPLNCAGQRAVPTKDDGKWP